MVNYKALNTEVKGISSTTTTSCMDLWQTIAFILSSRSMKVASSVCRLSFKN